MSQQQERCICSDHECLNAGGPGCHFGTVAAEHGSEEGGEGLSEAEINALDNAVLSSEWRAWVGTVERILADRLAAVQAERDAADHVCAVRTAHRDRLRDEMLPALRAERDDLRGRLAAAETYAIGMLHEADHLDQIGDHDEAGSIRHYGHALRAALANPSAAQGEGEA